MKVSFEQLRSLGVPLADSLVALESSTSGLDPSAVRKAVLQTWERLTEDAARGEASLSGEYLASLHEQLATIAGGEAPGVFLNQGRPLVTDNQQMSWSSFVDEVCDAELIEPAWVLAQLRWGGYVRSLSLSLGWLGMNTALLAHEGRVIMPPITDHARLLQALEYAGQPLYDSETLRALIGSYVAQQWTRVGE